MSTLGNWACSNAVILGEDFDGCEKFEATVGPCRQNPGRDTGEEDAGNQDVCIEDDLHPRRRTRRTALATSVGLSPARRACALVFAANV